jgi:hypothetical protein
MESPSSDIEKSAHDDDNMRGDQAAQEPPEEKAAFLLQFEAGDPEDPRNFGFWRKVWFTFILSMLSFLGLFGTSVIAPAEPVIAAYVHSSIEVTTLSAALFILGINQNH